MKLYIPEARKVEQIRNELTKNYMGLSQCDTSFQRNVYEMNIANLNKEMTNIGSIIKDKYLCISEDNTKHLQSIEEYIENMDIDNIFEVLNSKFKKPNRDYMGSYNSANYIKLMDELGIEIMYTNWPIKRNVVRVLDIDNLLYTVILQENYFE